MGSSGLTRRRVGRVVAGGAALLVLVVAGLWYWYTYRPAPVPRQEVLAPGLQYSRLVLDGPVVVHLAWIDLDQPNLAFVVTPKDPVGTYPLRGKRTSSFLEEYELDLAINGDFFAPWHSDGPWDYYPHEGDGVTVFGRGASAGDAYGKNEANRPTLYLSKLNDVSFDSPKELYHAISGSHRLLADGHANLGYEDSSRLDRHPRTAIGTSSDGRRMGWVVVDGRQPSYSVGMTLKELEAFLLEQGFWDAVNLDGGGSSVMVGNDGAGKPRLLSVPINHRIPYRERHVANHIGLRVRID